MPDLIYRTANVVATAKAEATEGVDPVMTAADAFSFELDSLSIGSPVSVEQSNEATGSAVAGAPVIKYNTVPVSMRLKLRGANTTYTAIIKPPMHTLLQSCGLKGFFQAAVSAAALTAGTTTTATLGAAFSATAEAYDGMPLVLTGAGAAGATPIVASYTAGKVATLTDLFGSALTVSNTAAIPANWTYAATSPVDGAARAVDQPSTALGWYEDGCLHLLLGFRGKASFNADTAGPGYVSIEGVAMSYTRSNVANPTGVSIPLQVAPTLNMQTGVSPAFNINRKLLPISQFSYDTQQVVESLENPNTPNGFDAGQIGQRSGVLQCDPTSTTLATRDHLADLQALPSGYIASAKAGLTAGNRWSMLWGNLVPTEWALGTRKIARSESIGFQATNPGKDAQSRDRDFILCMS